jgi:hypothetical protein
MCSTNSSPTPGTWPAAWIARWRDPNELFVQCRHSWRAFFEEFGRPDFNLGPEQPAPQNASAAGQLAVYLGRKLWLSPLLRPALAAADVVGGAVSGGVGLRPIKGRLSIHEP